MRWLFLLPKILLIGWSEAKMIVYLGKSMSCIIPLITLISVASAINGGDAMLGVFIGSPWEISRSMPLGKHVP